MFHRYSSLEIADTRTNIIPIANNARSLTISVIQLKGAHVAEIAVRRVGDIHDQRRGSSSIISIASEENGLVVEP